MRLPYNELDGRQHWEACVCDENLDCLMLDFYSEKNEAIKAVKSYKKNYRGNEELDCFVRLHDESGVGIAEYAI